MAAREYSPIVMELIREINSKQDWLTDFAQAVSDAYDASSSDMQGIQTLDDFYRYMDDDLLKWVPHETSDGQEVYRRLCKFYFVFGQTVVYKYQTPIEPDSANQDLTWLSEWLVRYAQELGKFMDTPESLTEESLETFKRAPKYHMGDYIEPHGGWKTFNQFFARDYKPGYRPIDDIANHQVIVSPADSTFEEQWMITDGAIDVTVKGMNWTIDELLDGSEYKDAFSNGIFMHAFLGPNDYHRLHAPVAGEVKEVKVIQGQVYLNVTVDDNGKLLPIRHIHPPSKQSIRKIPPGDLRDFNATDATGYQFCQTRGLFVLENPEIGLVAVLPIGMAQVSSVIPTAEVGRQLQTGWGQHLSRAQSALQYGQRDRNSQ
ncbi:hypothetical protein O1611_g53 [Lasiodiplodia mahajangana]|uniref:Uncharacterized protein n=1 Tax=Lasiodiplodia mahajangana TaxID=1108764 RepID=A0ACC2K207_9PEZI|nr:hypothetical protein O1611_g53 [Lasiodiplodia mahajangana]